MLRYFVLDEFEQVVAITVTRWTAERVIEGIKASNSPTSALGSWSIVDMAQARVNAEAP